MMQKPETKAFLEALQSNLWNRKINPEAFENLNRGQWIAIFKLSFHQTVEGMISQAIQGLPKELLPPSDLMLKWLVRQERIEQKNQLMDTIIAEQYTLFKQNGIQAILQKGHGVSLYYEQPSIRLSGDIDWYFPKKEAYHQANQLMEKLGDDFKIHPAYSSGYHYKEIEIEHHQKLVQLRNPFILKRVKKFYQQQEKHNLHHTIGGVSVEIPSPMLNILQVDAHILKHQITYGIGLRQLCDSARLYYSLSNEIDPIALKEIYTKLGMLKWSYVFHQVLVNLLGLEPTKLPYLPDTPPKSAWMEDYILRTGNFGFYDQEHPDIKNPGGRVDRPTRLFGNFKKFVTLAPVETICFPVVHLFSKIDH
ncbi:MAG: nucleotidyltransferase family protein [Sphingobacterium sp.]